MTSGLSTLGMRRLVLGCATLFLLSSCAKMPVTLEPPEVLRRANLAMQHLSSARFSASAMLSGSGQSLHLVFENGVLRDGGNIWSFLLREDGNGGSGAFQKSHIVTEVTAIDGQEYDIRPSDLSFSSGVASSGSDVQGLLGSWWRLPMHGGGTVATTVVDDTRLMQLQAQAIHIVRDRGVGDLQGVSTYHYDVRFDTAHVLESLMASAERSGEAFDAAKTQALLQRYAAKGEIWIDTHTFFIRRISWSIVPRDPREAHAWSTRLQIDMSDLDRAPDIVLPQNVQVLSPDVAAHLASAFSAMLSLDSASDHFSSANPSAPFLP